MKHQSAGSKILTYNIYDTRGCRSPSSKSRKLLYLVGLVSYVAVIAWLFTAIH